MSRLVLIVGLAAAVALVVGPRRLRGIAAVLAGLALAYAVLKVAGVVDAAFPTRAR